MTVRSRTTQALRQAFAAVDPARTGTGACPEAGKIWDAVHGRLAAEEVRGLAGHVVTCPSCCEDWRLARSGTNPPVMPVRPPRRFGLAAGLVAAAAVVFAVGLTWVFRTAGPEPPVYRDPGAAAIRSLVPEDVPLDRTDVVLRWSPAGEDARYDVEVSTLDLAEIASAHDLPVPKFRIPAEALQDLPPDSTLVWRVAIDFPDGARIVSDAFLVRIE